MNAPPLLELPLDDALLKVLSSDSRREILRLLSERRMTGAEMAARLELGKPAVAEHLKKLLESELIERVDDPERRWVYYQLSSRGRGILEPQRVRFYLVLSVAAFALMLGIALALALVVVWQGHIGTQLLHTGAAGGNDGQAGDLGRLPTTGVGQGVPTPSTAPPVSGAVSTSAPAPSGSSGPPASNSAAPTSTAPPANASRPATNTNSTTGTKAPVHYIVGGSVSADLFVRPHGHPPVAVVASSAGGNVTFHAVYMADNGTLESDAGNVTSVLSQVTFSVNETGSIPVLYSTAALPSGLSGNVTVAGGGDAPAATAGTMTPDGTTSTDSGPAVATSSSPSSVQSSSASSAAPTATSSATTSQASGTSSAASTAPAAASSSPPATPSASAPPSSQASSATSAPVSGTSSSSQATATPAPTASLPTDVPSAARPSDAATSAGAGTSHVSGTGSDVQGLAGSGLTGVPSGPGSGAARATSREVPKDSALLPLFALAGAALVAVAIRSRRRLV